MRQCTKIKYNTFKKALKARDKYNNHAVRIKANGGQILAGKGSGSQHIYFCAACDCYHLTSQAQRANGGVRV